MDWGDFGKAVSTFFVGFATRWGYDKLVESPKGKQREREQNQRLRTLLKENLENNLSLLDEIERDLTGRGRDGIRKVPTATVDLPILESTAGILQFELFDDLSTYNHLNAARCDLARVARGLSWLANMYFSRPKELPGPTTPHSSSAADNVFYDLARSTLVVVQSCQGTCRSAIKALDRYEKDNPTKRGRFSIR